MRTCDFYIADYLKNATSIYVAVIGQDGNIFYLNPSLFKLLGFKEHEHLEKITFETVFPSFALTKLKSAFLNNDFPFFIKNIELGQKANYQKPTCLNWEISILSQNQSAEKLSIWIGSISNCHQKKFLHLQAILESTSESSVLMDRNFRVLAFNKVANLTALKFHNLEIKEGDDFRKMILPQNRASFEADFHTALQGEAVISENELPLIKGKAWFECTFYPAKDNEGNIIGVTFTTSDIDQRKRAEEKIIANEKFFESVLQSQHEMICRFLPDTTITFVNNAYCKELGYQKEKIIGQKFLKFIPVEQRKTILEGLKRLNKSNPSQTLRHKVITAQKQERWHEWTDMALFDADGKILEFQSVGRDISDLTHSQANQERFRTIFENALHEIYLINPDSYQIYHANNAAVQNLELSVNAIKEMAYWEVLRLDYRKSIISKIKGLLSGVEEKIICEAEHIKSSGKAYPVETHLQKMCIEEEVFLVAICVDLSERKKHLASITKQNKILRDIAWIQSHMVRAPLANILGLVQVLKEEVVCEENQKLINMLEKSALDLDKVIRNVASKTHIVEKLEKKIKN